MIQIGRIRKGFSFFPNLETESIKTLFKQIDYYVGKIPKDEQWNCYYTLAHHESGRRIAYANTKTKITSSFISQDVIAFDIDGIDPSRVDDYAPIICKVLEIESDKTAVINSGNGLHFLILLKTPITDVKYFKDHNKTYKVLCKAIDKELKIAGLTGGADPVVFEPARIFRLPYTKNIKQKADQQIIKNCTFINDSMEPQDFKLFEVEQKEELTITSEASNYGIPDHKYIMEECNFLKWVQSNPLEVHEPEWYAMLSITSHFEDNNETSYELSKLFDSPSINKTNKELKIIQARDATNPRTCENINQLHHFEGKCLHCPHYKKVTSPIVLKSKTHIGTADRGFTLKLGKTYVRQYQDLVRYYDKLHHHKHVASVKALYIWDSTHYRLTNENEIKTFALEHFKPVSKAAERQEFYAFIKDSNITHQNFMTSKASDGFINFKNGVLNIETKTLELHDPKFDFLYCLPFEYDPNAKAPIWEKFISEISLNRKELIDILHEYMGFVIRGGDYIFHKSLILSGTGRNGKSTFMQILQALIGVDNCSHVSVTSTTQDRFAIAEFHGKLANFSEEEPTECFKETGKFKHITGNTPVSAQFKYGQPFQFTNKAKIIISYNTMPYMSDTSVGMKERLLIVPFNYDLTKSGNVQDAKMVEKLQGELSGIFNHALEGWERLITNRKFTKSTDSDNERQELMESSDSFLAWFNQNVVKKDGGLVSCTDCYESYRVFCEDNFNTKPMAKKRFGMRIKGEKIGNKRARIGNITAVCYHDIMLHNIMQENDSISQF